MDLVFRIILAVWAFLVTGWSVVAYSRVQQLQRSIAILTVKEIVDDIQQGDSSSEELFDRIKKAIDKIEEIDGRGI